MIRFTSLLLFLFSSQAFCYSQNGDVLSCSAVYNLTDGSQVQGPNESIYVENFQGPDYSVKLYTYFGRVLVTLHNAESPSSYPTGILFSASDVQTSLKQDIGSTRSRWKFTIPSISASDEVLNSTIVCSFFNGD